MHHLNLAYGRVDIWDVQVHGYDVKLSEATVAIGEEGRQPILLVGDRGRDVLRFAVGHGEELGQVLRRGRGVYRTRLAVVAQVGLVEEFEIGWGRSGGDKGLGGVRIVGVHDDGDSSRFDGRIVSRGGARRGVEDRIGVDGEKSKCDCGHEYQSFPRRALGTLVRIIY